MSLYLIGRYQTGIQDSVLAASNLLEEKAETLDDTVNSIVGRDILLLERDGQRCIGWMLFKGIAFDAAYHAHAADNLTITTNP